MTEDAVGVVVTAQEQTARLQLASVDVPALFASCVNHPETAALPRTLSQYRVRFSSGNLECLPHRRRRRRGSIGRGVKTSPIQNKIAQEHNMTLAITLEHLEAMHYTRR